MKSRWRIKGNWEFRTSVCALLSGKCLSECSCMCSVQRVLPVWGKSLFSWLKTPSGRTHKPHSSGWLTLLPGYRPVRVHTSWLPVFSFKLIFPHCFSLTCALARPLKHERPVRRNGIKEGRRRKEEGEQRERKSGPQVLWRLAPANTKPTKNEIGGEGGSRGAYENDVDKGNL